MNSFATNDQKLVAIKGGKLCFPASGMSSCPAAHSSRPASTWSCWPAIWVSRNVRTVNLWSLRRARVAQTVKVCPHKASAITQALTPEIRLETIFKHQRQHHSVWAYQLKSMYSIKASVLILMLTLGVNRPLEYWKTRLPCWLPRIQQVSHQR